jgi:hypothetical protein
MCVRRDFVGRFIGWLRCRLMFGEVLFLFLLAFPAIVVLFMTPVYRAFRERTFDVLVDVVPPEEHRH